MNKFFMGCLSVAALALMIGQAIAGAGNDAVNAMGVPSMNGVAVVETYSSSVVTPATNNNEMQPLPGDPGVEVAPVQSPEEQPVMVEEDMLIQQTEAGE